MRDRDQPLVRGSVAPASGRGSEAEGGGVGGVLGQLLPVMVAIALSSVPVMVTVTILLAPGSRRSALLFLAGWLAGMFAVPGLLTWGFQSVPGASSRRNQGTVGAIEVVLGLALMAYGIVRFVRRRRSPPPTELPKPLRSVGAIRPGAALGLGLLLNLRPKALLLSASAAVIIGTSGLAASEAAVALLLLVAVGGSTVTVPVVLAVTDPDGMRRPLEATRTWLIRHSSAVTAIVAFAVGAFVLGTGVTQL
jgi:Sap, sulfolipid-1-addressing protein